MSNLDQDICKKKLDDYYKEIKNNNCSDREKAEKYYAIIGIKNQCSALRNYSQSLYLDVKNFISFHLKEFYTEDYGYDIPNNEKLLKVIDALSPKEQLAMCRYSSNLYEDYGYETQFLKSKINKLQKNIALDEHHYASYFLRLSAQNIWTLLLSYVLFLVIICIVILPAPCEWMGVLQIEPHNFGLNPFKNHIMNTLAIVTGGDYAPVIMPKGLRGMFVIIIGKISFYVLIGNFIVKKLANLLSFD